MIESALDKSRFNLAYWYMQHNKIGIEPFSIYNPHLALIVYVVPILNVMLGGEENLSHRKIQHLGQVG